jgi:hypothetical protein
MRMGLDFFANRLAGEGHWLRHPVWGAAWRPRPSAVGPDFQPYTNGYWEYTDEYGWYWVSNDPFDDVVYHYGRWVYDPQDGWLWLPGYTWAPAWVIWREGDDYTGWMPMPPDEDFISGTGPGFGVNIGPIGIDFYNRRYGGRVDPDRFFVFVDNRHIIERDYRRFRVPRDRVKVIINRTRPSTKFEIVNNRVVNRGIDVRVVERATGRRITPVSAKTVIKPNAVITTVSEAKQIRQRERAARPVDLNGVRRGKGGAAGGNANPAAEDNAGGKVTGENGANGPGGNEGRRGRGNKPPDTMGGPDNGTPGTNMPEGRGNAEGTRMRNPGGESMSGPAGEETGRNRTRGNANNNTGANENVNGPDQTSATPSIPENPPVRRHRPGSTTVGPDQAAPGGPGASPGNPDETPNGNPPRRRSRAAGGTDQSTPGETGATPGGADETSTGNAPRRRGSAGGMSGPNAMTGGNGAGAMRGGSMNGSSAGNAGTQPSSSNTEQKKKRKPKPSQEQDQGSPE